MAAAQSRIGDPFAPLPPRRPRSLSLDAARILAIIAVVTIHVSSSLLQQWGHRGWWLVGDAFASASRWSVPLFVMVSGALLLDSSRPSSPLAFYRRRLLRVGLPLVVWTILYLAWNHLYNHARFDVVYDLRLILAGRPYYHLYFLYLIFGLYAIAPFLARFAAVASRGELAAAAGVLLALACANSYLTVWLGIGGAPNAVTYYVPYVGYFLAGAALVRCPISRRAIPWLALGVFAAVAATALGTYVLVARDGLGHGRYLFEYLSPTTIVAALCLFALLRAVLPDAWAAERPRLGRMLQAGSGLTFGVYLVHPIVLQLLGDTLNVGPRSPHPSIAVPLLVVATVLATSLIVATAQRIPVVRTVLAGG